MSMFKLWLLFVALPGLSAALLAIGGLGAAISLFVTLVAGMASVDDEEAKRIFRKGLMWISAFLVVATLGAILPSSSQVSMLVDLLH